RPGKDRDYLRADWLPDGDGIAAWVLTGKNPDVGWWAGVGPEVKSGGDSRLIIIDLQSKREKTVWRSKHAYFYACSPAHDEFLIWNGDYRLVSANGRTIWKTGAVDAPECMAFSPNGHRIAVYVAGKLQVFNRDTKARKSLYADPKHGSVRSLAWSPDGRWIAFRESRSEVQTFDPPAVNFNWDVLAVNTKNRATHEFAPKAYQQGKFLYEPTILGWTKDSKSLVMSVPEDTGKPYPDTIRDCLVFSPLVG
ncbi:MAG: hypothetical protein M1305_04320, partial [Candidatus Marsarchaeota archaeon]|nr:hypothetical protein [Candidatus Marsarchaeota archaeon]